MSDSEQQATPPLTSRKISRSGGIPVRPTIGRIVHYSYAEHDLPNTHKHRAGTIRPAIVISDNGESFNLQVFTDQLNDGFETGMFWATSRMLSSEPQNGAFHWPQMATKPVPTSADEA